MFGVDLIPQLYQEEVGAAADLGERVWGELCLPGNENLGRETRVCLAFVFLCTENSHFVYVREQQNKREIVPLFYFCREYS